ncbi:MAG: glycosyltransferase family 2 protein [bacterium]|nr:glycosyltransferase family 2 protein [bacterium]
MARLPEILAVVVNWNAGDLLEKCLEALLAQKEVDLEVVVVDNASSDHSLRALDRFPQVRLIQTGENLGFGRGVNRGVATSKRPYVVALNPDVALQKDALALMAEALACEPSMGLMGPQLKDAEGQIQASCGMPPRLVDEICRKFLLHLIFPLFKFRRKRLRERTEVGWVTGACFMARREALEAVGGMDEAIFMYYEDVDLCLRLRSAGWRVFYVPEAVGFHLGGGSSHRALSQMLVASEASYIYFAEKHLGRAAARILAALRPLEMGMRTLLWGTLFVVPRYRTEARFRLQAYWRILTCGVGKFVPSGKLKEDL